MAKPTPKFGLSLGQRLFLLTAALVILAVGASVLVTRLVGARIADGVVREQLERSTSVQSAQAEDRLDQLYLRALTVSSDPNFIAYLVEAVQAGDILSLTDQLDERQRDLGFTFAVVLDPEVQVVARTDLQGGDSDFSASPLVTAAFAEEAYSADGIWAREGQLYYAVLVPLVSAGDVLEGYLVAAYSIDDAAALELRQLTNTEVTFLLGGGTESPEVTVAATTLDSRAAEELTAALDDSLADPDRPAVQLELGRDAWLATGRPLTDVAGQRVGTVVNLGSLEQALDPFVTIGRVLGLVGLAAVALALVASFLLPRRILQPLRELARAAEAAAQGKYDEDFGGGERRDEVGQLSRSFSTLLSELREQRDMQVYLKELTRSIPEQEGGVATEALPPEERAGVLVGLELRSYSGRQPVAGGPREVLDQFARDLRRVSQSAVVQGGNLESTLGHRLMVSFEGARRSERALAAAAEALNHHRDLQVAAVLVGGRAISGTVTWQNRPAYALTGGAVEYLEGLLRLARPGTLLMSKSSRDELAPLLQQMGMDLQAHQSNLSSEPIYALQGEDLNRVAGPALTMTQQLPEADKTVATHRTASRTGTITLAGIGPGSVLGDRFEILSELGAGGMGVVYKARDRKLSELVAVKMLKHDAFGENPESLERLKAELKLARKIAHPNVLRTFDFGEADGFPFISMEFVRGVTLKRLLEQSGKLPITAGLHMARQLCRGLEAAHGEGVLHRDIKPDNMIIEPTGNTKLMDFGIAEPIRRSRNPQDTRQEGIVGTPYYLAPEQIEGMEPDIRADIYSCGVVLYEIFTGKMPFPMGGNIMKIIRTKLDQEPTPPSAHWPEIPHELERIIMRCLEKARDDRYAEVRALLADLEALRA
ncbi:MAG: protein kinase [Acidobacteriota bacterium]